MCPLTIESNEAIYFQFRLLFTLEPLNYIISLRILLLTVLIRLKIDTILVVSIILCK